MRARRRFSTAVASRGPRDCSRTPCGPRASTPCQRTGWGEVMAAVELWSGRGRDGVITLVAPSYVVGSDPDSADIAVDDPAVSRVHAVLERVGTTWLVRDVGSRNGTRVGGERL